VRIEAIVDPIHDRARQLAARAGVPRPRALRTLRALLANPPDVAVVCVPPAAHVAVASALLEAGTTVLCEKPLAIGCDEARSLIATAEASSAILTMASKFRFCADVVAAQGLVATGSLGRVVRIDNTFTGRVDMTSRWNSDPAVSGGGVIVDNGTHSVDILRFLAGPLAQIAAVEIPRLQPIRVEDGAILIALTETGTLCTANLSWSTDAAAPHYLTLHGEEATLQIGWRSSTLHRPGRDPQQIGTGYDKVAALRGNLANVIEAHHGRAPLQVTPADALASVHVVDSAYIALRQGGWVPVGGRSQLVTAAS
jgi:predicted dehydrogenase